jgi:hypothetical protein
MTVPFSVPPELVQKSAATWSSHEFYNSAVVLGIDIGIEGIGLYLRRGPEEIWAKSVQMELPEAEPLKNRRQMRAARHCRKNRKLRTRRLKSLMETHGLPWPDDKQMGNDGRSDPFILRHRALNQGVGSPLALAICIRHAVTHRGYDYSLGGDATEGDYLWGEKNSIDEAAKWLVTATIDEAAANHLREIGPELEWKGMHSGSDEERERKQADLLASWEQLIAQRLDYSREHSIARVLADHAKSDKHTNLRARARTWNFPRSAVEEHIRQILAHERHAAYLPNRDGFLSALFLRPKSKEEKERAIFHYNRKTRAEMELHWKKKTRDCPYREPLGLNISGLDGKCAPLSDWPVRRWLILEFLATRRLIIEAPVVKEKTSGTARKRGAGLPHRPSANAIAGLLERAQADHAVRIANDKTGNALTRAEVRELLVADARNVMGIDKAKLASATKETDPNYSYFSQLWDLVCPSAAGMRGTSSLCLASAEELFSIATGLRQGAPAPDFHPEAIHRRLTECEYYLWKRRPRFEFGCFPQVEKLTGPYAALDKAYRTARKATPTASRISGLQCSGLLGRIFRECSDRLPEGCTAPDYCVIEVVGDPPRNSEQKKEILKEQSKRRTDREAAFAEASKADSGVASRRRRIALHRQQGGICPFTGQELGDPLGSGPGGEGLEIEHLYPQSRGGLSVDDNLVLTTRKVNAAKGNRVPFAYSHDPGLSWDHMLASTRAMKWSARKREIFAWDAPRNPGDPPQPSFPDFANTTRVSQLARQLKAAVQMWMGVFDDADESTRRIGTPTGWHTAQARRTWLPPLSNGSTKVRDDNVHHLVDAAVISHIPPGTGLNSITCGGIFYSEMEKFTLAVPNTGETRTAWRPVTRVVPGLLPHERIAHWRPENLDYQTCPILKLSSPNKWRSLGDSTFWRQVRPDRATVAQRTPLNAKDYQDADALLADLRKMTPSDPDAAALWDRNLPSASQVKDWLQKATAASKQEAAEIQRSAPPLLLRDGTPIRTVWKFDSKGSIGSGIGWTGEPGEDQRVHHLRSLTDKYDRIELWLGFNPKKKEWQYQTRLIPAASALKHLKRMGLKWWRDKSVKAPAFLQPKPDAPPDKWKSLREIICSPLFPFSVKVGSIARRDTFRLGLDATGAITQNASPVWAGWYGVSAIKSSGAIELKSIQFKDQSATPLGHLTRKILVHEASSPPVLAFVVGLPCAPEKATLLGLNPPKTQGNDSPPDPRRRKRRPASDPGQADLGLT